MLSSNQGPISLFFQHILHCLTFHSAGLRWRHASWCAEFVPQVFIVLPFILQVLIGTVSLAVQNSFHTSSWPYLPFCRSSWLCVSWCAELLPHILHWITFHSAGLRWCYASWCAELLSHVLHGPTFHPAGLCWRGVSWCWELLPHIFTLTFHSAGPHSHCASWCAELLSAAARLPPGQPASHRPSCCWQQVICVAGRGGSTVVFAFALCSCSMSPPSANRKSSK